MDVMELGAIGELVGGVAVLVTLIYLALQVRQGNRVAQAQVHQEAARMSSQLLTVLDREGLDLLARAATDPGAIEATDLRFLRSRFVAAVNYFEMLFYAFEQGDVEPDIWNSRRIRIAMMIAPVRDLLWDPVKMTFGERFRMFVDNELLPSLPEAHSPVLYGSETSQGA